MDSTNAYIFAGIGTPIEQVNLTTGVIQYLVTDSLGSVRGVVASSGSLLGTVDYDAWGNPETTGLGGYTFFGYAGAYTDSTGMVYLIGRYYDPQTGQFLSVDPAIMTTEAPYFYAGDDPVDRIDPNGFGVCWAALEFAFTSASRQCWVSGYSNAFHHPLKVVALAGAITTVVLVTAATAGADTPVVLTIGGGITEDGADTFFISAGTEITAASVSGSLATAAGGIQNLIDCLQEGLSTSMCEVETGQTLAGLGVGRLPVPDIVKALVGLLTDIEPDHNVSDARTSDVSTPASSSDTSKQCGKVG
jgi:RHS repeat-associated protein